MLLCTTTLFDLLRTSSCPLLPESDLLPAHLLQPPPLLLLLLDTFLPLSQQLALVLLLLPELLLLEELLAPQRLRALLVLLLQADEVAAQGRLARDVDDGAAQRTQ